MEQLLIRSARVYQNGAFRKADVLCEGSKIKAISDSITASAAKEIDANGKRLVPGFIDAHTHGGAGVDVNAADEEGLRKIAKFFASQGTTSFNASVLTDTPEQTAWCLGKIQTVMQDRGSGAQILGCHLEGPFLCYEYKGAMPEHLLMKGDAGLLRSYQERFPGVVKYITVSPEVEGVQDMISEISDDIVVAIGHSAATYDQSMEAIKRGARCITHTFNAMRLFHQHEPAIMGAALESDDCWCEAICDGRHLVRGTVRMLLKCKGWDKVIAITDSIMAAGLPDGEYKLGVNDVVVVDGDAKLKETGVRAGSTLTTGQALKNIVKFTDHPVEDVIPLLTENVARALRMDDHKGFIKEGYDADLVLLDDNLDIAATIGLGCLIYEA